MRASERVKMIELEAVGLTEVVAMQYGASHENRCVQSRHSALDEGKKLKGV